jgi:hypothetical protein
MDRAFSTSAAGSASMFERTPRITPRLRRCRTSRRVSISLMIGTPYCARNSSASASERQLLASGENSRTTSPSMKGLIASLS